MGKHTGMKSAALADEPLLFPTLEFSEDRIQKPSKLRGAQQDNICRCQSPRGSQALTLCNSMLWDAAGQENLIDKQIVRLTAQVNSSRAEDLSLSWSAK